MKKSEITKEQLECKAVIEKFFFTGERLSALGERILKREYGINIRYFFLLDYLEEHNVASMGELKDLFYTSYQSFSQIIRQMDKDGVISKNKKGRNIEVSLTKKGLNLANEIRDGMSEEFLVEIQRTYTPEERKIVLHHMQKFEDIFLDNIELKINEN
ncbi:MAG: hypothetical protein N4A38_02540 [Candidatus Gracilibacteria bacterium]|nr:hypothetical protein [Candidatus Gracilibacteria bacterium]